MLSASLPSLRWMPRSRAPERLGIVWRAAAAFQAGPAGSEAPSWTGVCHRCGGAGHGHVLARQLQLCPARAIRSTGNRQAASLTAQRRNGFEAGRWRTRRRRRSGCAADILTTVPPAAGTPQGVATMGTAERGESGVSTAAGPILVVGATGTVGREVVRQLAAHGARVRAFVRDEQRGRRILGRFKVEYAVGDLAAPGECRARRARMRRAVPVDAGWPAAGGARGGCGACRRRCRRRAHRRALVQQ